MSPPEGIGSNNSRAHVDNKVVVQEMQPCNDHLNEDKVAEKQKVVGTKEVPQATNPYARPHLVNVSSATNRVIVLTIVLLRRQYTQLRGKKRKRTKFFVSQMGLDRRHKTTRMMMRGEIMWLGN